MHLPMFYQNREIFITGATGFLGKILLEKLLASCNVRKIYILVRSKNGIGIDDRIEKLLGAKIFDRLKQSTPDILNKVYYIDGDVTQENLGMSSSDLDLVKKNVSIVFHLAASIKFNESFRNSFINNVESTKNLADVCRLIDNLVALVHVSTAFSNCQRVEIKEKIYPIPMSYETLKDGLNDDFMEISTENVLENRPNVYTLTKAIAENLLNNNYRDLPLVIVRPSIVGCCWKEPLPGWNDSLIGINSFVIAITKAWKKALAPDESSEEIPVYNCISGNRNPLDWLKCIQIIKKNAWIYPSQENCFYPYFNVQHKYYWHQFCVLIEHTLLASFVDVLSIAMGRKPWLFNSYKKMKKVNAALEYFYTREWKFHSDNTEKLNEMMSLEDKKNFNCDVGKVDWNDYLKWYSLGIRRYVLKEDDSTIIQTRKRVMRNYFIVLIAKVAFFLGLTYLIFKVLVM
ncbi:putative fatty acyl-CoA reductase CG5065 isoform X2 [Centruroides sculpturatus]|uniref:putative fatty acyl-CoA reductase CG5065 isoform X2 n=1 Tax=Centruroides sculpturatus TaxID=218467 RepID=UPI000C6E5D26|nr:putative fatty acyl-CoA reductase CG5065 isoform X2 [Centruroides sculpturatus]